ncbi:Transmembrane protein 56-B [Phytophthora nicotianae]|uniref:Transmembrane protein 56-B n=1 Tax=Phytophthora nicotianae TaxID=4792 RepID=A0A0W8CSS9_PHYNI|nr:Transmembrane protein 56-B [Phytophthora nicotianae]
MRYSNSTPNSTVTEVAFPPKRNNTLHFDWLKFANVGFLRHRQKFDSMAPSKRMEILAADLEQQLREDQLREGDDWFLVSSAWWTRVLGASTSDDTDDDADDSDDALPRGNSELRVHNAPLLELELSSQKREVTVLKPMLVRGTTEL